MPVEVDLAQFPRVRCIRCGFVALVDPALPLDGMPSLTCPNCHGRLVGRHLLVAARRKGDARATSPRRVSSQRPANAPVQASTPRVNPAGSVPSNAAVGLTLAALFLLVLIGAFVWLMLLPHQHYWWSLTK